MCCHSTAAVSACVCLFQFSKQRTGTLRHYFNLSDPMLCSRFVWLARKVDVPLASALIPPSNHKRMPTFPNDLQDAPTSTQNFNDEFIMMPNTIHRSTHSIFINMCAVRMTSGQRRENERALTPSWTYIRKTIDTAYQNHYNGNKTKSKIY